jgi:hypothetical protein
MRFIAIADTHSGHYGGLTPPDFQIRPKRRPKLYDLQAEGWDKFEVMRAKAIDTKDKIALGLNGDLIDGNRFPHELVVADREEQCAMVEEIVKGFGADKIIMTRGTPSHVGKEEDWEDNIAKSIGADIRSEQFINIGGYKIYMRHKIGRSSIPYGKHSAPTRMTIWNQLKSAWKLEPEANWLLFSHVHYCSWSGNFFGRHEVECMTLPALQTVSQYGIKECEGIVHFGMVHADIVDGKRINTVKQIEIVESAKPQEIKL